MLEQVLEQVQELGQEQKLVQDQVQVLELELIRCKQIVSEPTRVFHETRPLD